MIGKSFGEIIDKALEKDLKARYESANALLADLRRLKRDTDFIVEARKRLPRLPSEEKSRSPGRSAGKIGAVLVDDEELARGVLREYLAAYPEIEILAECANGFEAVKAVTELKPDLLFLDIQMPKLNGFREAHGAHPDTRRIASSRHSSGKDRLH